MSEKREEVLKRYEAGESISKISKNLRINKSLIRSYLRERDKVEKEGRTEAVVYEDAVSGEEALQILDLYDFMAGAYLKEGLATGVLETKDCSAGPFTKESRLSGKALVYLASRARGDSVSFKKLFDALSRLSPAEGMREKIRALEEENGRLRSQADSVAEDLCSAKSSLQEAREYIKVLEKRPGDKEKIRVLEDALEKAKTALSDEQARTQSLTASLQAIRQILDKGFAPALNVAVAGPVQEPAPGPVQEQVKAEGPAGEEGLVCIKDWAVLNKVGYSTATSAARTGRITGLVMRGSRYFCPRGAVIVPKEGDVSHERELPEGYIALTEWSPLHGMSRSRGKRLAQSGLIPGMIRMGRRIYVHRDIKFLNPDGSLAEEGTVPLKNLCREQGVDYYAVRRKIAKVGLPNGAVKDARYLFVPEGTDLAAFLKKEDPRPKEKRPQKVEKTESFSTEGLVPFKALVEASGVPYMTAVRYIRKAGVEATIFAGRKFVPEGTDLLELKRLYGKKAKTAPEETAVPAVPAEPAAHITEPAVSEEDAVFNAAVATAAVKNVPVADVCNTVFKVMIDEYGYRLGDSPTFEAVRAENGERDFMAVLKNFDRHYQRLNAG